MVTFTAGVPVEGVQPGGCGAIRLGETKNGIPVESPGYRGRGTQFLLQVQWRGVVMVIVGAATVAAKFVEFAGEKRVGMAVVFDRIKDGHPVRRDRNGAAEEVILRREWRGGGAREKRKAPRVVTCVWLRQRSLLLPGGDAHHHAVIRHTVRFHVEVRRIVPRHNLRLPRSEGRLDLRGDIVRRLREDHRPVGQPVRSGDPDDAGPGQGQPRHYHRLVAAEPAKHRPGCQDNQRLRGLHARVQWQQREWRDRQFPQRRCHAKAVDQSEDKRNVRAAVKTAAPVQIFKCNGDDRECDHRLNQARRRVEDSQRGESESDRMSEGKSRHCPRQRTERATQEDQTQQERDMVLAFQYMPEAGEQKISAGRAPLLRVQPDLRRIGSSQPRCGLGDFREQRLRNPDAPGKAGGPDDSIRNRVDRERRRAQSRNLQAATNGGIRGRRGNCLDMFRAGQFGQRNVYGDASVRKIDGGNQQIVRKQEGRRHRQTQGRESQTFPHCNQE